MTTEPTKPLKNEQHSTSNSNESAWAYVLPFLAFMVIAMRYPDLQKDSIDDADVDWYFYLVVAQVVVCSGLVVYFFRHITRHFPVSMDYRGLVVGVIGVVLWVGLCELQIERTLLTKIGMESWLGERVGFNPFDQITVDSRRWVFLFFRFSLLALVIPVIEELFLRAWFMRYMEDPDWQKVSLLTLGSAGFMWSIGYGVITHPGEAIAAAAWFGMVTWLMFHTGKLWNCILAHAVTNLLLGVYIVTTGAWLYW